jgi:hypothetical protein
MKRFRSVFLGSVIAFVASIASVALVASVADDGPLTTASPFNPQSAICNPQSGRPWINLCDGRDLPTVYTGVAGLTQVLEHGLAQPLALASADFDEDGVPDLVSGYVGPSGGILALHRGNVDSIYPNSPEAQQRKANGTFTDSPFLSPARVFEVPEAPEFMGAGDFDADGHWDVVTAARGSDVLHLLPGDGRGGFGQAKYIELPGTMTALVTGEINRRDGLDDVVIGVVGPDGPKGLVFEWPEGALRGKPEAIALPAAPTGLALEQLDDSYEMDLAVVAGNELVIIHGRDRRLSLDEIRQAEVPPATIEQRAFAFEITSIALGDFVWDQAHQTDIALLADDGTVHVLINPNGVEEDAGAHGEAPVQPSGLDATSVRAAVPGRPLLAHHLSKWPSDVLAAGPWPLATQLVRAKVSSLPTDDLLVMDGANHGLHILTTGQPYTTNDQGLMTKDHDPATPVSLDTDGAVVAVLPMRLNVDALSDLVILKEGSSTPAVASTAPMATFTVTNTNDSGAGSLRQAILSANTNVSADLIVFNIPGAGPHTITPTSALPEIIDPVTIDGTTQPGFMGTPIIELNGTSAGENANGLVVNTDSVVRGLIINHIVT